MVLEDAYEKIKNYGYVLITSQKVVPCYYELDGGNILECIFTLQGILPHPTNKNQINFNLRQHYHVFSPETDRALNMPEPSNQPNPINASTKIINQDVDFSVIHEEFSVFKLSNKLTISVKPAIVQIRKLDVSTINGEPTYNVESHPLIKQKTT